jgi:hypothetical protein
MLDWLTAHAVTLAGATCALAALLVPPFWIMFRRAGRRPGWSLLNFVPIFGPLLALAALAIGRWSLDDARTRIWRPHPERPEKRR